MTRVLLISDGTLLGRGVECLLADLKEVEVVGCAEDPGQAAECLEILQPEVLILSFSGPDRDPTPTLIRCLENGWVQKIISVNYEDNAMCVLTSDRRVVEEVASLVEAITQTIHGSQQLQGTGT